MSHRKNKKRRKTVTYINIGGNKTKITIYMSRYETGFFNYPFKNRKNDIKSVIGNLSKVGKITKEESDNYSNILNEGESNLEILHDIVLEKLRK